MDHKEILNFCTTHGIEVFYRFNERCGTNRIFETIYRQCLYVQGHAD